MSYFPVGGSGKVKVNGVEVKLSEFLANLSTKDDILKSFLAGICYEHNNYSTGTGTSGNKYVGHSGLVSAASDLGYTATQFVADSSKTHTTNTVNITGNGILLITAGYRNGYVNQSNGTNTYYNAPQDIKRLKNGEVIETLLHCSSTDYNNSGTHLGVINFVTEIKEDETISLTAGMVYSYSDNYYTSISATLFSKDTGADV